MKYKVTLSVPEAEKQDYVKQGKWPLEIGGVVFLETTEVETEDLKQFAANPRHPYHGKTKQLVLDPRLKFEALHEDSQETD